MNPRRDCRAPHVTAEDLWPLLLHSVRYSMGRRTGAPDMASQCVRLYGRHLTADQREQIAGEIERELELHDARPDREWMGAACDVATWRTVAAWLRAHP